MANAQTPLRQSKQSAPLTPSTHYPTPLRRAQWRQAIHTTAPDYTSSLQRALDQTRDTISELPAELTAPVIYAFWRLIVTMAEEKGLASDIFAFTQERDRSPPVGAVVADNATIHHKNPASTLKDDDEMDIASDGDDSDDVSSEFLRDRLQRAANAATEDLGQTEPPTPNRPRRTPSTLTPWQAALQVERLISGNGATRTTPRYVGATSSRRAPRLKAVTMDITPDLDVESMSLVQQNLHEALTDLTWEGTIDRRRVWEKLHPWAVTAWVNWITVDMVGSDGLHNINKILQAAARAGQDQVTSGDVTHARQLSISSEICAEEQSFYKSVGVSLSGSTSKNDVYVKFNTQCESSLVVVKFQRLVDAVREHPATTDQGIVARSVIRTIGFIKPGQTIRDQVAAACAKRMGWTIARFNQLLERNAPLADCSSALSSGVLMLAPANTMTIIKNNCRSALPHVLRITKECFPELEQVCEAVHANIMRPLYSSDPEIASQTAARVVAVRPRDSDMLTLINEMTTEST